MARLKERFRRFSGLRDATVPEPTGSAGDLVAEAQGPWPRSPAPQSDPHVPEEARGQIESVLAQVGSEPPWRLVSFLLAVALPTIASFLYLVFLAQPQFVSESRFVLRGSLEKLAIEGMGQAAMLSAMTNSQEAHVVADYIRSPRIVADLSSSQDLRQLYSWPKRDPIWRLDPQANADELVRYWQRMVKSEVDTLTGIVTVQIHAFSPQDALDLNRAVLKLSGTLVADFTRKMLGQRVAQAEADAASAHAELDAILATLQTARERETTLDPLKSATDLADLVSTLRDERAALMVSRNAAAERLNAASPTLGLTDERIRSLDAQIRLLVEASSQKPRAATDRDLISAAALFDMLDARKEIIIRRVSQTETALTRAKLDAAYQQVYLEVFMAPTLGEQRDHPRILMMTLAIAVALAAIWGLLSLYVQTIRERMW